MVGKVKKKNSKKGALKGKQSIPTIQGLDVAAMSSTMKTLLTKVKLRPKKVFLADMSRKVDSTVVKTVPNEPNGGSPTALKESKIDDEEGKESRESTLSVKKPESVSLKLPDDLSVWMIRCEKSNRVIERERCRPFLDNCLPIKSPFPPIISGSFSRVYSVLSS